MHTKPRIKKSLQKYTGMKIVINTLVMLKKKILMSKSKKLVKNEDIFLF